MAHKHIATVHPLPSSILHNSAGVRSHHTRAAAKIAVQFMSRKMRSFNRKAVAVTDITQMQGGH
ncbi:MULTISPECIES: hypothetical protein [unclassified Marinobacter]|uniref:hypothetical protein n=1 Tax=unclassified Marinobacter TaxID=83889 RepID=UPI0026E2E83B|nr:MULTISPECIES: hypothetical protein [unclassified Marinobacter]MDO6442694.1 hypothetical protein [Marinobacter sp. 2_MG-2023]MDO6823089.1 hypothetical protein [Marinobacter sp. 1_MG-2023]